MNISILKSSRTDNYASLILASETHKAYIGRGASGNINVCSMNAMHTVWRGAGRTFRSFEEAEQAYKSSFMKAAIALAQAYL